LEAIFNSMGKYPFNCEQLHGRFRESYAAISLDLIFLRKTISK